jgi:hypothetical protein
MTAAQQGAGEADDTYIYRFRSDSTTQNADDTDKYRGWGPKLLPTSGYKPIGVIETSDGTNVNVVLLMNNGPVVTISSDKGKIVTTNGAVPPTRKLPAWSSDGSSEPLFR